MACAVDFSRRVKRAVRREDMCVIKIISGVDGLPAGFAGTLLGCGGRVGGTGAFGEWVADRGVERSSSSSLSCITVLLLSLGDEDSASDGGWLSSCSCVAASCPTSGVDTGLGVGSSSPRTSHKPSKSKILEMETRSSIARIRPLISGVPSWRLPSCAVMAF